MEQAYGHGAGERTADPEDEAPRQRSQQAGETGGAHGHDGRAVVARELRRTVAEIQRWTQRWLHRRTGTSLSPNETHLLSHLQKAGPQRMSALAAWQNVDKSTMTMQVKTLLKRGFVQRSPDPEDRRAVIVELTEAGREVLAAYADRASEILADSLEGWSDEDLSRFSRDLARFAGDLESALEQTIEHRG